MTETEPKNKPATYTVRETAEILRKGINQTYEAIHAGQIPSVKIGGRYYVPIKRFEREVLGE